MMNNLAEWICDMLGVLRDNPDALKLIHKCGGECCERDGTIYLMRKLRKESSEIDSLSELLSFLSGKLPAKFEKTEDGFIVHLGNPECLCKMRPALHRNAETLCECTNGYQLSMWSEFFGYEIETEILDTVLRGGNECNFKIKV